MYHKIISLFLFVMLFITGCGNTVITDTSKQSGSAAESAQALKTSGTTDRIAVSLIRIVDGDTIKVLYNGEEKTVRYLLIDTPETKAPNTCVQPYGKAASDRNEALVRTGTLELEFDAGDRLDKYSRLLAYVYSDGVSVQQTLIEEGLARVAYIYPPNTRYLDTFEAAEKMAKDSKVGIWSTAGYASESGFNGCSLNEETEEDPDHNQSESAAEIFANCTELRKTYPDGVSSDHPAYQAKMDRDKDGYACES